MSAIRSEWLVRRFWRVGNLPGPVRCHEC